MFNGMGGLVPDYDFVYASDSINSNQESLSHRSRRVRTKRKKPP